MHFSEILLSKVSYQSFHQLERVQIARQNLIYLHQKKTS